MRYRMCRMHVVGMGVIPRHLQRTAVTARQLVFY